MERISIIPRLRLRRSAARRIGDAVDAVLAWMDLYRQRRALLKLDDRMLKDIGLSRLDVEREAEKPFWRP